MERSQGSYVLLVHDFGASRIVDEFSLEDTLFDIETITHRLLERHFINNTLLEKMVEKIRDIKEIKEKYPLLALKKYWLEISIYL